MQRDCLRDVFAHVLHTSGVRRTAKRENMKHCQVVVVAFVVRLIFTFPRCWVTARASFQWSRQEKKRGWINWGGKKQDIFVKYPCLRTNWSERGLAEVIRKKIYTNGLKNTYKKWKSWLDPSFLNGLLCNYEEHFWQSLKFNYIYNSEIQSVWYKIILSAKMYDMDSVWEH